MRLARRHIILQSDSSGRQRWVDFDLSAPLIFLAAQPHLPNVHQHGQNMAESGPLKIDVNPPNPVHDQMDNPVCRSKLPDRNKVRWKPDM